MENLSQLILAEPMFSKAPVGTTDRRTESKHAEPFASCLCQRGLNE